IPRTGLRIIYEGISGRYTHLVLIFIAAIIWTVITAFVIPSAKSPALSTGAFLTGFMFIPATCLYPILEKSPDGLCLILSGIGSILYIISVRGKKLPMFIASIVFYGLAVSVSPAYMIFNICVMILYLLQTGSRELIIKNTLISVPGQILTAFLTSLVSGGSIAALIMDLAIQGAVLFPVSIILLILCRKDIRYILPMLFLQYALIIDFGRYIGAVRVVNYVLIPIGIIAASVLTVLINLRKKSL
nr:hypothetical protein [Lachnospiraceae bacterium]